MTTKTDELKDKARHLIAEGLKAAEMRQGCTDYGYHADVLLRQLEPVVWDYAPVPARIERALKYGNQTPGEPCVFDMDGPPGRANG